MTTVLLPYRVNFFCFQNPTGIILFKDSVSTCLLEHELHKSMVFTYFMFSFQSSSMVSPFQVYTNPLIRWGRGEKREESRKTPLWPAFWMQTSFCWLKNLEVQQTQTDLPSAGEQLWKREVFLQQQIVPWVSRVSAELVAMGVCFPAPLELEVSHSGSSDSYLITSD